MIPKNEWSSNGRPSMVACQPGTSVSLRRRTPTLARIGGQSPRPGIWTGKWNGGPRGIGTGPVSGGRLRDEGRCRRPRDSVQAGGPDASREDSAPWTGSTGGLQYKADAETACCLRGRDRGTEEPMFPCQSPRGGVPAPDIVAGSHRIEDRELLDTIYRVGILKDPQGVGEAESGVAKPYDGGAHVVLQDAVSRPRRQNRFAGRRQRICAGGHEEYCLEQQQGAPD